MSDTNGLGTLKTDALFLGLTRPVLIGGVTFAYFAAEMLISVLIFIMTSNFKVFLVSALTHAFGIVIKKKEPLAVDLLLAKYQKTPVTLNKNYHGGLQSYNMFG